MFTPKHYHSFPRPGLASFQTLCRGPLQVPHLQHSLARTIKAQALDSQHWLCCRAYHSLCYPAGQENEPLNLFWAHLQDLMVPASTVGNQNHSPAAAKMKLMHILVCTEGKSLSAGLSRLLQMFQMPACFIWGQPPEPQHGQENLSFHRR